MIKHGEKCQSCHRLPKYFNQEWGPKEEGLFATLACDIRDLTQKESTHFSSYVLFPTPLINVKIPRKRHKWPFGAGMVGNQVYTDSLYNIIILYCVSRLRYGRKNVYFSHPTEIQIFLLSARPFLILSLRLPPPPLFSPLDLIYTSSVLESRVPATLRK